MGSGHLQNKLPITHAPGLLVVFTCLSETDFSSVAARGTLEKLYSHKEAKNTSGLVSCTFMKDRADNEGSKKKSTPDFRQVLYLGEPIQYEP